jgi:non-heme Fe2+,alpha-ketoglutarate-dependent halogenase
MTALNASAITRYREEGFCFPLPVLQTNEAALLLERLDAIAPEDVAHIAHPWYYKSYLLFTWLNSLVRNTQLLDAVECLVGENIICISCDIWRKRAGETRHISWHQDASYWAFEPPAIVTAWIALTEATTDNGCMRFLPGSHRGGLRAHRDTFASDNMLSHGQTVQMETDENRAVPIVLRAGEFSLHHCLLAHASAPNPTELDRVGLCIRYAAGNLRQTEGPRVSAMAVRGRLSGNLVAEKPPTANLSSAAVDQHTRLLAPHAGVRYTSF